MPKTTNKEHDPLPVQKWRLARGDRIQYNFSHKIGSIIFINNFLVLTIEDLSDS